MVRSKWSRGPRQVLDRISSVDSIGEVVTQQTPVAEQITGEILPSALVRWIPRLPRLRSLQLWDGAAVGDERIANLITVHCPGFDDLSIFRWDGDDTDHQLSVFMSGLPPNRLRGFETISQTGIAAESFLALSSHADSLKELKLHVNSDTLPHLGLLKGCNNLELFELEDANGNVDLEKMQNDVFLDMVVWLRDCHKLRTLSFAKFHSAAALLGQVLFNDKIHLEHLHLDSYVVKDQKTFHLALANQTTLTRLSLRGNSDLITYEDRSTFVESICQLKELRDLKLVFVSDDLDLLTDVEIAKLVRNLPDLEALFFTGYGVTDGVLDEISNLRALRSITFSAVTAFSVGGLLDFVNDLGPGNRGLQIYIDNADPDSGLTDEEQELVRTALWTKVGGRLEYQLLRGESKFGNSLLSRWADRHKMTSLRANRIRTETLYRVTVAKCISG